MNVVMIRTNKVDPDPRVEKEANSICAVPDINLFLLAWDRTQKYSIHKDVLTLANGCLDIYRFGIPCGWGTGMRRNFIPAMLFELKAFVWLMKNRRRYDCVHACDLMTALPALLPVVLFHKKMIYDICDITVPNTKNKLITTFFRKLEYRMIKEADYTILCSEKRIHQIEGSKPKEVIYIHNSPCLIQTSETQERQVNQDKIRLVYVGNLVDGRWIPQLLKCVSESKEFELHVGGFGLFESLVKEYADRYDNIVYYGKLEYSKVLQLESVCDIMLALYEPRVSFHVFAAPNKFYESLMLGKPVIMFHNTGMDELVDQYDIGVTVEPTEESFMEGLKNLVARKKEWDTMSQRMKSLFHSAYSWEIMESRLRKIYINLMSLEKSI